MKKVLLLSVLILSALVSAEAQMAKFQALFIFQFAKNTSWPPEDDGKPFNISVIGDNPLAQELKTLCGNKNIGARKIQVAEAASAQAVGKSDIIFLGKSKSAQLGTLLNSQAGNKVLIVTGQDGLTAKGAGICFLNQGAKIAFQINEGNISKYGLHVTAKLLSLAAK